MNRIRQSHCLASSNEIRFRTQLMWRFCQVKLWWRRLTSPDCCSSLTAGGQPDIPSCPVRRNRQHRTPPRTQPWWNAESESHQASRSTTAHHEHKGQIHISSENTINQNENVDNSPGQKNGSLFIELNDMTHSHKKEHIWLSSNEVDEVRAFNTEWTKSEREQISYINTYVWNLERWFWWTYL